MRYRSLGKTGLKVSEIGLGGEWLERRSGEEVTEVIKHCEQVGINILDCFMSEPKVRSHIGEALKGHREKWIIQGHVGAIWENEQYVKNREMPKIKAAFEDLLVRLKTDYIDIGMIHYVDQPAEFEAMLKGEHMAYMQALKAEGKIRHIGISTHNAFVAKAAALSGVVEVIMLSVNPAFDRISATEDYQDLLKVLETESLEKMSPERRELYQICECEGVGITVMKGYAGGRLLDGKVSPFKKALTPIQCIHYALTRPAVASVLVGCQETDQVDAAVAYETATDEEKDYADFLASVSDEVATGQCTYCGHCAPCPEAIDIAMVNKLYDLATMQEEVPATVKGHYRDLAKNAEDCIACGGCMERCPFGVDVIDRMTKAAALFK